MSKSAQLSSSAPPVKVPRGLMFAVLRSIPVLGLNASGTQIREHLSQQLDKDLPSALIYVSLSRLLLQGLVKAEDHTERPAGRRGRPRRIYHVTASGLRALEAGAKLYGSPVNLISGVATDGKEAKI
jgi:DNA-binding PadR family transcriptional regulator